jgi:hypothetical protein
LIEADSVRRRTVEPLAPVHRVELVRAMLGLGGDLAAQVADRTGGNPLFVVQLLGDWVQRGVLVPGADGFRLAPGATADLPDDLHAVWAARVRPLVDGDPARAIALGLAAALGLEVHRREWEAVCARAGVPASHALREALVERRLARQRADGFAFAHGMLRESVVRLMREAGRWQALNAVCAEVLLGRDAAPQRVGRHALEAERWELAANALLLGARRHLATRDYSGATKARGYLELRARALDALGVPADDARRAAGSLVIAQIDAKIGDADGVIATIEAIVAREAEPGFAELVPSALRERAWLCNHQGDWRAARHWLEQALQRFEAQGRTLDAGTTMRDLAAACAHASDLDAADGWIARGRAALASIGADRELGALQIAEVDVARHRGDWALVATLAEGAVASARRFGLIGDEARALNSRAEAKRLSGIDLDGAERDYEACVRLERQLGDDATLAEVNLALCQIARGKYADAHARLTSVQAAWEAAGRFGWVGVLSAIALPCSAGVRDWNGFDEHLATATDRLRRSGLVDVDVARSAELGGDLAAAAGAEARARSAWGLAADQWRQIGDVARAAALAAR